MHIVAVDPSTVVTRMIADMLVPGGHRVVPFCDAEQALSYVRATPSADVLLTSLEMTPISGLELCWQARVIADAHRPLHIVVMSSQSSSRSVTEALDSGADDFMMKPVGKEELRARLRAAERIMTLQRTLATMAETDPLTGLLNRRAFFRRLSALKSERGLGVPLVAFDIDHFKRVNDTHGHDVGDAVIQSVGREAARIGQFVARIGGEEFAMALPNHALAGAMRIAERLRVRICELTFDGSTGPFNVTASFGLSLSDPGEQYQAAMKRADVALYRAKGSGRNRIDVEHENSRQLPS